MTNGIDYDLKACLEYNPQSFDVSDIKEVLAVWEGERDRDRWIWIIKLGWNKFAYLSGGCCYTGWDCQSGASSSIHNTAYKAAKEEGNKDVFKNLHRQLLAKKKQTWREKMDEEFKAEGMPIGKRIVLGE
jgi:hypothetical protein